MSARVVPVRRYYTISGDGGGQNENFLAHLHTQQVTYILRIYTHGSAAIIALWSLGQLVVHQST